MPPARQPTRRADFEGADTTLELRELLDELAKEPQPRTAESQPSTTGRRSSESLLSELSPSLSITRSLALSSHRPMTVQYLSMSPMPGTGFVLTSPHRQLNRSSSTEHSFRTMPFSKQVLLVEVLGIMNHHGVPNFQSRPPPVNHLAIDLFRPAEIIPQCETWPKRARRLLEGIVHDSHKIEKRRKVDFPLQDLAPLVQFRHLRYMKIEGMMQDYQTQIWQCVWLNHHLHTLILSMSCAGERLSAEEIRVARLFARNYPTANELCRGYSHAYLKPKFSVAQLSLSNFIVDARPFEWFNGWMLKQIEFIGCLDAGFAIEGEEWSTTKVIGTAGSLRTTSKLRYIVAS